MSHNDRKYTYGHVFSHSLIIIFTERIWLTKNAKLLHTDNKKLLDCADAQDDLSLSWVYMGEGTFSHTTYYLYFRPFSESTFLPGALQ